MEIAIYSRLEGGAILLGNFNEQSLQDALCFIVKSVNDSFFKVQSAYKHTFGVYYASTFKVPGASLHLTCKEHK